MANLEVMLRYAPVKKVIAELADHGRILEIGGGSEGFSSFTDRKIFGVDMHFSRPLNSNIVPCVASAYRMPFPDNAFDAVISMDMLEHIPANHYNEVIAEIVRLSKRIVILGFPSGTRAAEMEKKINAIHMKMFNVAHFWLGEHIANGLPDAGIIESEFRKALPDNSCMKVINNVNVHIFFLIRYFDIVLGNPSLGRDFQPKGSSVSKPIIKRLLSRLLYPVLRFINTGECYRKIFIITMPPHN